MADDAADVAAATVRAAHAVEDEAMDEAAATVRAAHAVEDEAMDEAAATVRAAEAVEEEAMEEVAIVLDDLTVIVGIGPVKAEALSEVGITSLLELASAEAAVVASAGLVSEDHAAEWVLEASGLIG
jgi:predicted flap endonuclease-1-like 5' DNA nuclease